MCRQTPDAYNCPPMYTIIPDRSRPLTRLSAFAIALGGVLTAGGSAASQDAAAPAQRFKAASRALVDSTTVSPLIRARATGHLAAMSGDATRISSGLRACLDERSRLAYLDAALAGGSRSFDRLDARNRALEMLATTAPEDRAPRIERELRRIENEHAEGSVNWGSLTTADLVWRPFTWSPESPVDRLARLSPSMRRTLIELEDPGPRSEIIAAVLAGIPVESTEERREIILDLDLDGAVMGPAVMRDLARRRATDAMTELASATPAVLSVPAVRIATAAWIARDRPDMALRMIGGEDNISRLPGIGQSFLRRGLAEGLRGDPDPELWKLEVAQIGQTDDRLEAMLALATMHPDDADPAEIDPERTFEEVKSMRTLTPGRVASAIEQDLTDRDTAIQALADLLLTGRYDLAFSFLAPNTTEPTRKADHWLPVRIGLLGEALADADAAPDAWIPLVVSVKRLGRLDGQTAALRAIHESYDRVHGDADLPDDLRRTLDDTLIEIAID